MSAIGGGLAGFTPPRDTAWGAGRVRVFLCVARVGRAGAELRCGKAKGRPLNVPTVAGRPAGRSGLAGAVVGRSGLREERAGLRCEYTPPGTCKATEGTPPCGRLSVWWAVACTEHKRKSTGHTCGCAPGTGRFGEEWHPLRIAITKMKGKRASLNGCAVRYCSG